MPVEHAEIFAALAAPFGRDEVKSKPGAGGRKMHFITARQVMNRLDTVLGPAAWWDDYLHTAENSVVCRLSIRLPDGRIVTKCDAGGGAGMADAGDDDKSAFSDALKRAAVKWGVGRELYGDGVAVFFLPEAQESPRPVNTAPQKRDNRPYHELASSGVGSTNATFREDHPGAADVVNLYQLDRHLVRVGLEAGAIDATLVPDQRKAKALDLARALSVAYGTPDGRAFIRREMAEYLAAQLGKAREKAVAGEQGDGEVFDGLVEVEGGELVPAAGAADLEPDAGMNG